MYTLCEAFMYIDCKDKELFNILLTDEEVAKLSQDKFTNFVKKKAKEINIEYLTELQDKHSKSMELDVEDMDISPYLNDARCSKTARELLFKLTVAVKQNYKNAYLNNDMLFPCTQSHPLQCPKLTAKLVVEKTVKLNETDVYGTVDQQLVYVNIYQQFWELREKLLLETKDCET